MLKNLAYLSIFTTFVVAVWIGLSVYHNATSSTISSTATIQIDPISPTFDTDVISALKKRSFVESNLSETIVFPTGAPALPSFLEDVEESTGSSLFTPTE